MYGRRQEFWTENAASPCPTEYYCTPTEENLGSWEGDGIMHVPGGVAGDVTGVLTGFCKLPSDYINTILYPEATSDGFIEGSARNAFKNVNKCALAKKYWGKEYKAGTDNCTVCHVCLTNVAYDTHTNGRRERTVACLWHASNVF